MNGERGDALDTPFTVHRLPFTVYASLMPLSEALRLALGSILRARLRYFFTLLGIIVSVGVLVVVGAVLLVIIVSVGCVLVVVSIIQGMNAYVKENLTGAMIGTNAFQVRRSPISVGLLDDEMVKKIARRPIITFDDGETGRRGEPER